VKHHHTEVAIAQVKGLKVHGPGVKIQVDL
jgi:hypothetical protein